jgi:hypothetical protein
MVAGSIHVDNKLTENFYKARIKTLKMLHNQTQVYCSKSLKLLVQQSLLCLVIEKFSAIFHSWLHHESERGKILTTYQYNLIICTLHLKFH